MGLGSSTLGNGIALTIEQAERSTFRNSMSQEACVIDLGKRGNAVGSEAPEKGALSFNRIYRGWKIRRKTR